MVDVSGTIDEVLEQVGDDPELAREAYLAEQEDKNRSTLLAKLDALANTAPEPPAEEDDGAGVGPGVSPKASSAGSTRSPGDHVHTAQADDGDDFDYVALRPLRVPGREVRDGEVVPEAKTWTRPEAYERLGYIKKVPRSTG